MPNAETGITVTTMFLGQFAKDVVDAKVLEGQCKGKIGWDWPNKDTEAALKARLQEAVWGSDYANALVYATMLQARVYNQDPPTDED